jgi:hypothetical protein
MRVSGREPDHEWDALSELVTSVSVLVAFLNTQPLPRALRLLSLTRLREQTQDAADIAGFLHARAREGREPNYDD